MAGFGGELRVNSEKLRVKSEKLRVKSFQFLQKSIPLKMTECHLPNVSFSVKGKPQKYQVTVASRTACIFLAVMMVAVRSI